MMILNDFAYFVFVAMASSMKKAYLKQNFDLSWIIATPDMGILVKLVSRITPMLSFADSVFPQVFCKIRYKLLPAMTAIWFVRT